MSDKMEVLNYLKKHKYITDEEAREHIGTTAVRSRISELKKEGHHIVNVWKKVPKRGGKTVKVAEYMLVS